MTRPLRTCLCTLLLVAPVAPSAPSVADETAPTGRQIMEWVDARDDGDHSTQDMQMLLIDKNGGQRKRTMRTFGMDKGEDNWSIMFFLEPADVKDTGFLTYDYDDPERDDDQWLYLPALKKTKRIASGDKSGAFMGSDFTYSDMTDRNLDSYDYKLLQESEVAGQKVWVVEAIPNNKHEIKETGYTKQVLFVRQDNYVVVRAKSWVKKGSRNKYFDIKKLELIEGIWTPTEMHMTTKKGKKTLHKTVLVNDNVKYDQEMDDDSFSVRKLEQGL
ncbi:MAG: outer membrane lipoprotein-sorting protein [Deltaproteobacteria bacterium]|nr:outer membrane lipoprotein-sorting protein [Deltaproteobacteria bacterium]MBW2362018.1 outer membrane lipoprotein-sorting protein [Deltaproteobacteria bacterium]